MTRLNVRTNVTAPDEINIPLIRADFHQTSGIFRVCFEVALSLFSTLLGYVIQLQSILAIHYIGLGVTGIACATFLYLSHDFGKQSKNI